MLLLYNRNLGKRYFSTLVDPQELHIVGNAIPFQEPIDRTSRSTDQKMKFYLFRSRSQKQGYFELMEAIDLCTESFELH